MEHHDEPPELTIVLNFINQLFIAVFALECVMKPFRGSTSRSPGQKLGQVNVCGSTGSRVREINIELILSKEGEANGIFIH